MRTTVIAVSVVVITYFITVVHAAAPMALGEFSCTNSIDDVYALELTNGRVRINNFTNGRYRPRAAFGSRTILGQRRVWAVSAKPSRVRFLIATAGPNYLSNLCVAKKSVRR
jgi:hypothetical protein